MTNKLLAGLIVAIMVSSLSIPLSGYAGTNAAGIEMVAVSTDNAPPVSLPVGLLSRENDLTVSGRDIPKAAGEPISAKEVAAAIAAFVVILTLAGIVLAQRASSIKLANSIRELESSKSTLERIFSNIKVGILMVDAATRTIEEANSAAEELFGYGRDELIGSNTELIFTGHEKYMEFGNLLRSALEKEDVLHTEYDMRRKDGRTFTAEVSITGLYDEAGRFVRSAGVFRDITQRKIILEHMDNIFKLSKDLICVASMTHFLRVSPSFLEVLGYTEQEMLEIPFMDLIHPDDIQPTISTIEEKLKQGVSAIGFVNRYRHKDGSYRWLEWMTNALTDKGILYGVARDITGRKHEEAELARAYEIFEKTFANESIGMAYLDRDFNFLKVNRKYAEGARHEPDYFIGKNHFSLYPNSESEAIFKGVVESGETYSTFAKVFEHDEYPERGETYWDWSLTPVKGAGGEVEALILSQLEVTDRVRAEMAVQQSLREKEVLLKEVHHRVKNNMTIVSSLLSLQSGYVEDEKYRQMFRESQNRIRTMALVHEKLYQTADFSTIDVREYVMTLLEGIKETLSGNLNVKVSIDVEEVDIDLDTLIPCGLIINELLTNSFKHAFTGLSNPEIKLTLKKLDNERAELTILDNGVGLPGDLDISELKGLGFMLVSTLAEQIGGSLDIRRGQGASVCISFPVSHKQAGG